MACATGRAVPEEPDSPDAALPFLSAGAGLLLAAALADMPEATALDSRFNHWRLDLTLAGHVLQSLQHLPKEDCRHAQPRHIRATGQSADPRRWDRLDR